MRSTVYVRSMQCQLDAAMRMLDACLRACPDRHWRSPVGTCAFWHVAYHALCWTDFYLARSGRLWKPDRGPAAADGRLARHPAGRKELTARTPSRMFDRVELLDYSAALRARIVECLESETEASLNGPSGFPWIHGPRAETYMYNLRHLAHHTGQLSSFLRRVGAKTPWVTRGERGPAPNRATGRGRRGSTPSRSRS